MRIIPNNHLLNIFLILICVSPNFIFLRQDIWVEDNKYLLIYYIFFFSFYIIFYQFKKIENLKNIYFIFLSMVIFLGFDKNFKLWLFFQSIIDSYQPEKNAFNYIISFIFFLASSYLIFKILSKNEKIFKSIAAFIVLFLSIFNISSEYLIDTRYKDLGKIIKNNKSNNLKQNTKKNIVIFLDGLVGPGGIDDKIDKDIGAKKSITNLYKKHDFKLYTNAYSIYYETIQSIPAVLNFDFQIKKDFNPSTEGAKIMIDKNYMKASSLDKNSTYFLNKNKFFKKSGKKIFATKNRIFNFCNKQVSQCHSLNHNFPSEKKYVSRFESLIKDLRDERSILYQYLWRVLILLDFDKEYLFVTDKVFFQKDLNYLENIISNTDFDTYLSFYMYPHSPFVIEKKGKNCRFKEFTKNPFKREDSREAILEKHYQEIYCGNLIIDKFLDRLKENNNFDNLNILIISDTGMKIDMNDFKNNDTDGLGNYDKKYLNDAHKVLFAIKKGNSSFSMDNNLISSQELFSKYFNKDHSGMKFVGKATVFDTVKKVFVDFD
jgi:hypothetical protein